MPNTFNDYFTSVRFPQYLASSPTISNDKTHKFFCGFVVDGNDEDADYDNVQGRSAVYVNVNNVASVECDETGTAGHDEQPETTVTATAVTTSETTKHSGKATVKKEKKMFSWGRKKKNKPKTAAGTYCDCTD